MIVVESEQIQTRHTEYKRLNIIGMIETYSSVRIGKGLRSDTGENLIRVCDQTTTNTGSEMAETRDAFVIFNRPGFCRQSSAVRHPSTMGHANESFVGDLQCCKVAVGLTLSEHRVVTRACLGYRFNVQSELGCSQLMGTGTPFDGLPWKDTRRFRLSGGVGTIVVDQDNPQPLRVSANMTISMSRSVPLF